MEHLSRDSPFFCSTAQRRLARARSRPIFPPRPKVAAHDRNLGGEVLFDVAEEILRAAEDELGVFPLRIPLLHNLRQPGSDSLVVAEGPIDEHRLVRIAGVFGARQWGLQRQTGDRTSA